MTHYIEDPYLESEFEENFNDLYEENVKIIDYHFLKEIFSLSKNYSASFDNLIQLVCKEDLIELSKIQKIPSNKQYTTLHLKKDIKKITSKNIIDYFK